MEEAHIHIQSIANVPEDIDLLIEVFSTLLKWDNDCNSVNSVEGEIKNGQQSS